MKTITQSEYETYMGKRGRIKPIEISQSHYDSLTDEEQSCIDLLISWGIMVIVLDPVPPTPPAPPEPPPTPGPTPSPQPDPSPVPVPASSLVKCAMFIPAKSSHDPWPQLAGVEDTNDWVRAHPHGPAWETDYRKYCISQLQAMGANAIMYYADALKGAKELQCYICDTEYTRDGKDHQHIPDSDNCAVWLAKAGVTVHVVTLTDSPAVTIPWAQYDNFVKEMVAAYATARKNIISRVVWLVGLECNRNMTVDLVNTVAGYVWKYAGKDAEVVCGSSNQDFLKQVHAKNKNIQLWKETDGHPINAALTLSTCQGYIRQLDELAALVGPSKIYAGEWWSYQDMTAITKLITAKGYNCGCGRFK